MGGIFVQREEYCLNHSHVPAACTGVAILRSNSNAGTCGQSLGEGDVAVGNLNTLPCGTQLCLNPGASPTTKTVADHCGRCSGDAHHIDSFSAKTQCHLTDQMPGMIPTLQIYNN